ncbi:MAG: hypothetical protein P1U83_09435 [Roseovarius sp.]|nr:hypothetical protein [Roseovarius sp.]
MRIWQVAAIYTLAFMAGLVTLWAFLALGVMQVLESRLDSVFVMLLVPVMSAMCVFSVIYGLASGRALKWQYWLFTTLAMSALIWGAPRVVMAGYIAVAEMFVLCVLLVFACGFLACLRRDAVTAPAILDT